jgi:hypothetical protein
MFKAWDPLRAVKTQSIEGLSVHGDFVPIIPYPRYRGGRLQHGSPVRTLQ